MESFLVRYRNLVVLLAILMAQIAGLAVQVRHNSTGMNTLDPSDSSSVRLIRLWGNAIISPPERLIHGTKIGLGSLWTNYINLGHVRDENQDLKRTVDRLRLEQAALLEDARQGQRLQALLGFQEKYIYTTMAAQAYGSSGSDRSHVFYIDKGEREGLKPDMAVITADGIVGKVRDVFLHTAQVLAVNDATSGAGVILETTRIRGILKGDAVGRLEVVGVTADQRIKPGEKILTAGGDLIFPRGLPVGVVEKVVNDPERDGMIDIIVKPAAHLERLDEVLVITSTEPRFSPQEEQDIAASESQKDVVPTAIKDQVKASEIMAEKLPGLIDPNLPPDQQPLHDTSNPNPAPPPPKPLHPDEFSPGATTTPGSETDQEPAPKPQTQKPVVPHAADGNGGKPQPAEGSNPQTTPQRNP
ncbi:MAG TPA: rod shape-determining protein MreC [Terracidiphilus sp.]|nr:rod shape-determining protein MreC [Terracidiphilus sp.]